MRVPALLMVGVSLAASAAAQTVNVPEATLLLDGVAPTAPFVRSPGAPLRFVVRGAPFNGVLLGEGPPASIPYPQFGGTLSCLPSQFRLNASDPAFPGFAESFLAATGEALVEFPFAPPAGAVSVVFQALVGDPLNTVGGFTLTAPVTVTVGTAASPPSPSSILVRGPYLEQTGPVSSLLTVRLDQALSVDVDVGPDGISWPSTVTSVAAAIEHTIPLVGLLPASAYRYRVRTGATVLADGPGFRFRTAPLPGSSAPFRFVAWGDSGTGNAAQIRLSQQMADLEPTPDFALILGDIVYPAGEAALYDQNFFLPYKSMLASMSIWPAYGNHDDATAGGAAYFANFHLPATSPGGERYYSFDWGDAHFVCLDTQTSLAASNPMFAWLAADLAATTRTWRIVFFHHPPYTGGTHSDHAAVQATIVPLLDAAGVDLVLSGHSHVLERSYLLANHSVVQNHAHDYDKSAAPTGAGAVYAVAGAGGQVGALTTNPNHPLMAFQLGGVLGELVVEIEGQNLRGYFLDDLSVPHDHFSITKGADTTPPIAAAARSDAGPGAAIVVFDEPVQAGASAGGAEDPARYLLDGVLPATSATLDADLRTVRIVFPSISFGVPHQILVQGVADRALPPNLMSATTLPYRDEPWRRIVLPGGHWNLFEGVTAPPIGFADRDFDDSGWIHAHAPVGFGGGFFPIGGPGHVLPAMLGGYATFYARAEFWIDDPDAVGSVRLEANFDDGFVAYLNGVELARRGVPLGQDHTTLALNHPPAAWERFPLPGARRFLVSGRNVLTFEIHNQSLTSSDAYFDGALSIRGQDAGPGLRLTAGAVVPENHGVTADFAVGDALEISVDGGPASALAPVRLVLGFDALPGAGWHAAVLPFASFAVAVCDATGSAAFDFGPAPAALIGFTVLMQALTADASSAVAVVRIVP